MMPLEDPKTFPGKEHVLASPKEEAQDLRKGHVHWNAPHVSRALRGLVASRGSLLDAL